jgi:hypothetical protein
VMRRSGPLSREESWLAINDSTTKSTCRLTPISDKPDVSALAS